MASSEKAEVAVRFAEFFHNNGWRVADVLATEAREAQRQAVDDLPLAAPARAFLDRHYPAGIYLHQKEALRRTLAGENVCMATGTASGKSLVFQTAALDLLSRDPKARVMAIYPMKALGNEQRDRWQVALSGAGLAEVAPNPHAASDAEGLVGRIDGNVPPGFRLNILARSRVVVFTPDIIHAWLFSNLKEPIVIEFLRDVRLIVVDEVHTYSGVFGSNAAFLYRRIQHLLGLMGAQPRIICASATIAQPVTHLRNLFGQDFALIGPDLDSSPRFPLEIILVEPPGSARYLEEVVRLLDDLTHQSHSRFLAFVDSRKQVELISSILNRLQREAKAAAKNVPLVAPVSEDSISIDEAVEGATSEASVDAPEMPEAAPVKTHPRSGWGRSGARASKESDALAEEEADPEGEVTGVLQQLNVLPYRAGYEDHDRRQIQERLADGTLNGVVSTSALELGIDVPNLDVCILIGVPISSTSLQQRIGRIGRHAAGVVIVINGGDVHDQAVFANPPSFLQRPLAESTLYLENEHIQYIHALCLARLGGEHDQVNETLRQMAAHPTGSLPANPAARAAVRAAAARSAATHGSPSTTAGPATAAMAISASPFTSPAEWPENFLRLCQHERANETPRHLINLKNEARNRPNYTFPLRDVESQFKVERRDGPNTASMGSLSFGQLMREAYPGAIYYYATIPYRVTRVNVKSKTVSVRREKRYTTQPQKTLPAVFPRLTAGGVFSAQRQGGLFVLETNLLVRESIRGVIEQRGRTENIYPYPLAREMGFFQDQAYFSRNYFTTGVVLAHPALSGEDVHLEDITAVIYEAYLLLFPFERQDIGYAADRFRQTRPIEGETSPTIAEQQPFLTIYDQVYGSLRLSRRLLSPEILARVLAEAFFLARYQPVLARSLPSLTALKWMAEDALQSDCQPLTFSAPGSAGDAPRDPNVWERIVYPGSKGLMVRTNEEFHVLRIVDTPLGVSYEGTPASMLGTGASLMPLLTDVTEIPGESLGGWYHLQTGQIEPAAVETGQIYRSGTPEQPQPPDTAWMRRVLSIYVEEADLAALAGRSIRKADQIETILQKYAPADLLARLLALELPSSAPVE